MATISTEKEAEEITISFRADEGGGGGGHFRNLFQACGRFHQKQELTDVSINFYDKGLNSQGIRIHDLWAELPTLKVVRTFSCHKVVLAAYSQHFYDKFKDPVNHKSNTFFMNNEEISSNHFDYVLTFIYSGMVTIPRASFEDLRRTAEKLQIQLLMEAMDQHPQYEVRKNDTGSLVDVKMEQAGSKAPDVKTAGKLEKVPIPRIPSYHMISRKKAPRKFIKKNAAFGGFSSHHFLSIQPTPTAPPITPIPNKHDDKLLQGPSSIYTKTKHSAITVKTSNSRPASQSEQKIAPRLVFSPPINLPTSYMEAIPCNIIKATFLQPAGHDSFPYSSRPIIHQDQRASGTSSTPSTNVGFQPVFQLRANSSLISSWCRLPSNNS